MKMPAPVRVVLNHEEERTLSELRPAHEPQRTRDRAHMVRLNAQGWNAPAEMFECCEHTVRATLRRWQQLGLGGLWDAPGRGDKPRWQAADLDYLAVLRAGSSHLQQSTIGTKAGAGTAGEIELTEFDG